MQIMHHLAGHTNVVHLQHVYEDRNDVCLAMELCSGGELLDSLSSRGKYSEKVGFRGPSHAGKGSCVPVQPGHGAVQQR